MVRVITIVACGQGLFGSMSIALGWDVVNVSILAEGGSIDRARAGGPYVLHAGPPNPNPRWHLHASALGGCGLLGISLGESQMLGAGGTFLWRCHLEGQLADRSPNYSFSAKRAGNGSHQLNFEVGTGLRPFSPCCEQTISTGPTRMSFSLKLPHIACRVVREAGVASCLPSRAIRTPGPRPRRPGPGNDAGCIEKLLVSDGLWSVLRSPSAYEHSRYLTRSCRCHGWPGSASGDPHNAGPSWPLRRKLPEDHWSALFHPFSVGLRGVLCRAKYPPGPTYYLIFCLVAVELAAEALKGWPLQRARTALIRSFDIPYSPDVSR